MRTRRITERIYITKLVFKFYLSFYAMLVVTYSHIQYSSSPISPSITSTSLSRVPPYPSLLPPFPSPSKIVHSNPQFIPATTAIPHHTPPTQFLFNPHPNAHPPTTGPAVLAPLDTLCAKPWIVPRLADDGLLLFTRMTAEGSANVRLMTCNARITVRKGQRLHFGRCVEGKRLRYGSKV